MSVPKVKTLLVGVGGVGGQIVTKATESLTAADRRYVAAVCFDTDSEALENLKKAHVTYIQTSERTTPAEYCAAHRKYTDYWYPMNPYLAKQSLDRGAGQVRATSRLAFCAASESPNKLSKFVAALNSISLNDGSDIDSGIRIIVVSSLAGGTGSGLVVQLPFYIRNLLRRFGHNNVRIRGLFLGAEVFEDEQGDRYKKQTVISNAYACIKELNGLYAMQEVPYSEVPIKLDYYTPTYGKQLPDGSISEGSNDIPYDLVYLIEKRNNYGNGLETASDYINLASQMIRVLFFTQIGQTALSHEDNTPEMLADTGGMARFCGVGYSKAIYPYNDINEYCSLRWMKDCVNNSWLVFDRNFEIERARREREKAHDPALPSLKLAEEFIRMYTDSVKSKTSSRFSVLMSDVFRFDASDDTVVGDDRADSFAKSVDKFIQQSITTDSLKKQSAKCRPDTERLMRRDEAAMAMQELYSAGDKYVEMIPNAAVRHLSSAVQSIIPSISDSLSEATADYSLPALLKQIHPLSARYLLYRIHAIFEAKRNKCESARDHAKLDMLREWDAIPDNSNEHDKAITAVNDRAYKNNAKYAEFIQRFTAQAEDQANEYDSYRYNFFAAKVYAELLDRIDILIAIYEQFFKSIPSILAVKDRKIELLEKKHDSDRQVEYSYVFGSSEIKQMLYKDVRSKLGVTSDVQLDDAIKENLFYQLFERYCTELTYDNADTEARRNTETERIAATKKIFDESIIKDMLAKTKARGRDLLDIGILKALLREAEIAKAADERNKDEYGLVIPVSWADVSPRLLEFASRALPFLSYNNGAAAGGKLYWGVNTELLDRDPEYMEDTTRYDIAKAQSDFAIAGESAETIADLGINRNELICYRTVYGLRAEDLIPYAKNSNSYNAYAARVAAINRWENSHGKRSGFISDDKERIHPHIDKHWHLPAYLPPIYSNDAKDEIKRQSRAFFLSIAMEMCYLTEIDDEQVWRFRVPDPITGRYSRTDILKDGERIMPTYYGLLMSLPYNTMLVDKVISAARAEIDYQYNHRTPASIETDILTHDIIVSLIGNPDPKFNEGNEIEPVNIFDVFIDVFMRSHKDENLLNGLLNDLSVFVTEYCQRLTDSPASMKRTYRSIMREIYINSALSSSTISAENKASFEDITHSPANI